MLQPLRDWLGEEPVRFRPASPAAWVPQPPLSNHPASVLTHEAAYGHAQEQEIAAPPEGDPRVLFPLFRWMREHIPDVSAGVWAWVRICNTPLLHHLTCDEPWTAEEVEHVLTDLDRRIFGAIGEQNRGVESLVQSFFLSIFTYGAFAGEVILDREWKGLGRFVMIDPATVRFRLDASTGRYLPYQIQPDNSLIALNEASFFYFGLDTDGLSPYGRSPLMSLPMVVRAQQQLLQDMQRSQHNAGYPLLHFRLKPSGREPGESNQDYIQRLHREMEDVRSVIGDRQPEHNLVTYDTVQVEYLNSSGTAMQWSESLQAISEQVISALHLAPFMLGRNWGTTQSWGNAQYQLIANNARSVQVGALRLADWLRNLHLSMLGIGVRVEHRFEPHHLLDLGDRAKAFREFSQSILRLKQDGIMDEADVKQRLKNLLRYL